MWIIRQHHVHNLENTINLSDIAPKLSPTRTSVHNVPTFYVDCQLSYSVFHSELLRHITGSKRCMDYYHLQTECVFASSSQWINQAEDTDRNSTQKTDRQTDITDKNTALKMLSKKSSHKVLYECHLSIIIHSNEQSTEEMIQVDRTERRPKEQFYVLWDEQTVKINQITYDHSENDYQDSVHMCVYELNSHHVGLP